MKFYREDPKGDLVAEGDVSLAFYRVRWHVRAEGECNIVDAQGRVVGTAVLRSKEIPGDYDPHDKSNFRSCCDPPA